MIGRRTDVDAGGRKAIKSLHIEGGRRKAYPTCCENAVKTFASSLRSADVSLDGRSLCFGATTI